MAIGQTVVNWRFTDIFNMAAVCPPSGICYARLDHPQRAFYGRPIWNRTDHYIFMLLFVLLSSSFFFFPRLISAAADWMSAILPHMVWP